MKKLNYIIYILLISILTISCNSELDTKPTNSVTKETIIESTSNAYYALNGINRLMVKQYWVQGLNGEGTIKMYHGNYVGNYFGKEQSGVSNLITMNYINTTTSDYCTFPWFYYYRLIADANILIENIDAAEGLEADKKEIKARALTIRAYSFFMLSQLYCKRWVDSDNGSTSGLVMRLSVETPDQYPTGTLKDVYDQVYKDLDDAIAFFSESKIARKYFYDVNIDVAMATYARAALTKNDYAKAAEMAAAVKAKYPLMSNAEMKGGFYTPNKEWIWGSYGGSDQSLFFYSYHAYIAYNSTGSLVKSYPTYISRELYRKIPRTDIRSSWWYGPQNDDVGEVKDAAIIAQIKKDYKLPSDAKVWNYMQLKISSQAAPGIGNLNHFRSSEMYLIQAEALARQGKDAEAQEIMIALNKTSGRDPEYTCTKTGQALIDEIMTYRAIELWGEGFDWFDLKRTRGELNRLSKSDGGNFLDILSVHRDVDYADGWVLSIPSNETDYNKLVK